LLSSDSLVSIGLPVRNAGARLDGVVESVLAQDHGNLELVISDNASTDATEQVCRDVAATDPRIRYHRQPENVGLLNNFLTVIRLARGEYFRWIGDDDRLKPGYVSRCLQLMAADPRLILVTTQVAYTGPDGEVSSNAYRGTALGSDDPVDRFCEMLRLLNEEHLLVDPLYGLVRRSVAAEIRRRNMIREDEVFALKLALAGPWGHLPEMLAQRSWQHDKIANIARRLGLPAWQAHASNTLAVREILRALRAADLTREQQRRARAAVVRMYLRRQQRTIEHRGRKLARMAVRR
jgi:glycosyltransferase involved in cell wall biosynthesis